MYISTYLRVAGLAGVSEFRGRDIGNLCHFSTSFVILALRFVILALSFVILALFGTWGQEFREVGGLGAGI